MKKYLLLAACLFLFLCACGVTEPPVETPTPAPTPTVEEDVHQEEIIWPTGEYDNPFGDVGTRFTLTETQQKLFDKYSENFNFDISVFKGAAPVDVAQVFIECGINGLWEGEYNLFYFETRQVRKVDFKAEFDRDASAVDIRTRRDYANLLMSGLKDGKFVDDGGGYGHIEFKSYDMTSDYEGIYEAAAKLNLKQVDGIWMINQNNMLEYI